MKSILGQQSPQSSPWAPARLRQEMQTGGSGELSAPRTASAAEKSLGRAGRTLEVISARSIAMAGMLERGRGDRRGAHAR
jgi:hypothetical protein